MVSFNNLAHQCNQEHKKKKLEINTMVAVTGIFLTAI